MLGTNPSSIERAEALAASGRIAEAKALMDGIAGRGDGRALFALGVWNLAGSYVPRDLTASRQFFRRASETGIAEAAAAYRAFLASGTGGPADWRSAVELLERAAASDPAARRQLALIDAMALSPAGDPLTVPIGKVVSPSPAVSLFRGILTPQECDYLVEAAKPLLQPAVVVHPTTGRLVPNPVRTSEAAAFPLMSEDPAIHALNRRIAAASGTDVRQGEPLQVLRYSPGQEYKTHGDAIPGAQNQRVLTFLVYLNDGYDGGETHFPQTGLSVRGRTGDGLLFRNTLPDGRPDERAVHAGLPVLRGQKLLATRWIRSAPIDLMRPLR